MFTWLVVGVVALVLLVFFLSTYTVIGPNEAHVIVFMGRGRKIKSPVQKDGVDGKTSYFYIPFLMKRHIMPLTNVKLDIKDIFLNDKEMAPFECDVITWVHIEDPIKAAERLDFSSGEVFQSLHTDLINIVQAIARTAAMGQEILEILRDRKTFSAKVSEEVDPALSSWGVKLVNLEVNDIRDQDGSNVIQNYEAMRKASVQSTARIEVAKKNREAIEAEQENKMKAEIATAEAEKQAEIKKVERDTKVGLAAQERDQQIAEATTVTNEKKVKAVRVSQVGQADIEKEAAIVRANGEGEAIRVKGEKEAAVLILKGKAEAEATQARGLAEATAKEKMAEALQKFNDAATNIEKIRAAVEVQKAFAEALGHIAQNAEIKWITSGEGGKMFGFPLNAQSGADLGQMIESLGVDKIKEFLGGKKEETK